MFWVPLLLLLAFAEAKTPYAKFGKITGLPGQPEVQFDQFAGQLQGFFFFSSSLFASPYSSSPTVNKTCPAYLFAWVAKAADGNDDAPVVLFSNGGPGSSTFLAWFFEHVGPFSIESKEELSANEYAWNEHVDVIMFDQPAGVGLSYVSDPSCLPKNVNQSSDQWAYAVEQLYQMEELGLAGTPLYI
jgi:pimeloyl-ACP methyl ester carboxylesterase